jgi:glutathione synthase/RimK-type ligase-like ATP-grasp enzyme
MFPMTRIAFVTCAKIPGLTADDQLCVEALRQRGVEVDGVRWDDATVSWKEYDSVVLRSTWDYHLRPEEFRAWIERCERDRVRLWNPGRLVRWNMDKAYLRDLSAVGVAIPDCEWIERGSKLDLAAAMQERNWDKAVLKPTISASAHQTHVVRRENAPQAQDILSEVVGNSGAMLQQFMTQVEEQGEWALLFFGGEFSHAVLKTPKAGDFRVQSEHGGNAEAAQPAPAFLAQARQILSAIPEPALYARVDACDVDGRLVLMELELIEPDLFLRMTREAPARFAAAIMAGA